jgi:hypothetical protein
LLPGAWSDALAEPPGEETDVPGSRRIAVAALLGGAAVAGAFGPLQAKPTGRAGLEPCPSRSFAAFLDRFSESAAVQRAFTYFPLTVSEVVDGRDEPATATVSKDRRSLRYPVFPSRRAAAGQGLERLVDLRRRSATVILRKPDTDFQLEYRFVRTDCWYLVEKRDMSL